MNCMCWIFHAINLGEILMHSICHIKNSLGMKMYFLVGDLLTDQVHPFRNFFLFFRAAGRNIHWEICHNWCVLFVALMHNWARVHYRAAFHPYGRFYGWDARYPWSWVCSSPREENSNWWALGRQSSKVCQDFDPWRNLGNPKTCCCN